MTAPTRPPPQEGPQFNVQVDSTPLGDPDPSQIPGSVSITVGTPDTLKGSVPLTLITTLSRRMWVVWSQKQVVVETSINNPSTHQWTAHPSGFYLAWGCNLRARIHYKDTFGAFRYEMPHPTCGGSASGPTEYKELVNLQPGTVWGQRSTGTPVNCAPMPSCFRYSGSTTWRVYPWWKHLKVTASPKSVLVGDSVSFTAARNDGYVLPSVVRWIWVPKDSTVPARTIACATTSTVCRTPVYEDGWMFAEAQLDGIQTASAGVNVTEAKILLTASTTTPIFGAVVTYTASSNQSASAPVQVTGWKFIPDDTSIANTTPCGTINPCGNPATTAGVMWVYGTLGGYWRDSASVRVQPRPDFKLRADKSRAFVGETVTFTPYLNGEVSSAARWRWEPKLDDPADVTSCVSGPQCQKEMAASGQMWAYTSGVPGQGDSASASVTVGTLCSPANSASAPCSLAISGTGGYHSLQVRTYGGVTGSPLPTDSILVIAYRANESVPYSYRSATGHVDLAVVADDTLRDSTGTLLMNQNRTVEVAADFNYAVDPEVVALRQRFSALLRAGNKVEAYRQHLEWFANFGKTAVRAPDSLDFKLTVARNIEFDYGEHGTLVLAFDDALRGHAFLLSAGTGPKTVTVWSAFDDEMAAAGKLQAQLSTSVAASSSVPAAAIVYVNGIRTPREDAEQSIVAMHDLATAEPGLEGVPIWLFWNRTADAQVDAYASGLGCAGRYAFWDEIRKRLTNNVQYSRCRNKVYIRRLFEDDIAESMRQFMNVVLRVPVKTPEDVPLLARFTVDQHELGLHTIFTVHSQGNLILSQTLPVIPGIPQSSQATSKCTAAVSLASPIGANKFMADTGAYLRGITIGDSTTENANFSTLAGDDLLLRAPNTNYGTHRFARRTSGERDAGLDSLARSSLPPQMKAVKGWILSLDVHFVGPNYFRDPSNSREIANFLVGLRDSCGS